MKNNAPRVLQLIDSLDIGGAERMSVNLANALTQKGVESFLCATRKGGALESMLDGDVTCFVLHKQSTLDMKALYRLVRFIKKNGINVIHAHSTSFFTAVLVKPFTGVKIVWHDHYGNAELLETRPVKSLRYASYFFDAVISVNEKLAEWSRKHLLISDDKIAYLPNFAELSLQHTNLELPGDPAKRIVCLANLRRQKDHMTLLHAFKTFHAQHPDWHLLLVGEDRKDDYSAELKAYITKAGLENSVHILGARSDSADILLASAIGVLSSASEGLPVALLEYGLAGLPVVVTDVGQCPEVLAYGAYGKVIPAKESKILAESILKLIEDEVYRESIALKFNVHVIEKYSSKAVIQKLVRIYGEVLDA